MAKSKKVIVTGGLGYIGSHTCVLLSEGGYSPVIIDNLDNSRIETLGMLERLCDEEVIFEQVDLKNRSETLGAFQRHKDSLAIIHFAAYKAVGESMRDPIKYYHNNLTGMSNVLEGMRQASILPLIFSSSCAVYGNQEILPVTENSPTLEATSPYGRTKQICEAIITDTQKAKPEHLRAISLRYFNPIGAHPSGMLGEYGLGAPENLIPYVMETATGQRDHLRIWGDDYDTPDGTAIRDYIHVMDIAEAHILALERILSREVHRHEFFNLGSGKGFSVMEVVDAVSKVVGSEVPYKVYDRRSGDIPAIYADASKAISILKWQTKYSLEDMIRHAWEWEQNGKQELMKLELQEVGK